MSINSFKDPNQQYLPIRRTEYSFAPTTTTPFQTLGDEIWFDGTWYKAVAYSPATGYQWLALSASSGGGGTGLTWQAVSVSTQMVSGNGYILQNTSAPITLALPTSSVLGSQIAIVCDLGCAGFSVSQGASQQIVLTPTQATTAGAAGSISVPSPAQAVNLTMTCSAPNTRWVSTSSFGGFAT